MVENKQTKLTEDEVWKQQLLLSGFVARYFTKELTANETAIVMYATRERSLGNLDIFDVVAKLKRIWWNDLCDVDFSGMTKISHCIFCSVNAATPNCKFCPARKINPKFNCADPAWNWQYKPVDFFKKLLWLSYLRKIKPEEKEKQCEKHLPVHPEPVQLTCKHCDYIFYDTAPLAPCIYCPNCRVCVISDKPYNVHPANRSLTQGKLKEIVALIGWKMFMVTYPGPAKDFPELRPGYKKRTFLK